jgi:hypothetical protein
MVALAACPACRAFGEDMERGIHTTEKEIKGQRPPPAPDAALPQLPAPDGEAPVAPKGDGGDLSL